MLLQRLRRRLQGEREGGFTLIELMVVVLIIAILIAIAIPTFLGARQRAQNRATQSNLRNGLTAAKTVYTDRQDYQLINTDAEMQLVEPNIHIEPLPGDVSTTPNRLSVSATLNQWAAAAITADNARCFYIRETVAGGTVFGTLTPATCTGTAAAAAAAGAW